MVLYVPSGFPDKDHSETQKEAEKPGKWPEFTKAESTHSPVNLMARLLSGSGSNHWLSANIQTFMMAFYRH